MFLFLCSFSIAFWGCLVLFYFYLRFIKNFQIIREEFPFFSQFFTIHLNCCGGLDIVRNPGGRHTQALFTFLSLCPRLLPWARSVRACYSFTLSTRLLPRARSVRVCYSFTLSPRLLPRDRLDFLALCEGLLWPSPASHRVSS